MNKPILVPEHIADELNQPEGLEEAYIKPEERYLDPSKLSKSVVDRLPQPTGWRILILPYQGQQVSDGGIHLPEQAREREAVATVCGYVLRVGNQAYTDYNKYGRPWCKQGDWVIFGRYAGSRFKIEGGEVRILNDDEIIATISSPEDILHV